MTVSRWSRRFRPSGTSALTDAWADVAAADRVPPELRTDEPDAGYSHLAAPRALSSAVRHLYAVRLAGGDRGRYRQVTSVGVGYTTDTLHGNVFDAYVAWLHHLEQAYPGVLDRLVAAYRAADAAPVTHSLGKPSFTEVIDAYDARAAALEGRINQ